MSANNDTQLTKAQGYNTNNMTFGKPKVGTIGPVQFTRIPIGTRNEDGTYGDLVIAAPRVYSFGLSVNTNMQTGSPDGYTLPLCLQSRDGPTQEEKDFLTTFNAVVDKARQHVLDIKNSIGKYELEAAELKKMNPLYIKKDKKTGKPEDGAGPVLYPKLIQKSKNVGKNAPQNSEKMITTQFYDKKGNDIDPMSLIEKHGFATAAIKFESIFIGAKISLKVVVYEAEYELIDQVPKRLRRPVVDESVSGLPEATKQSIEHHADDDDDEDDDEDDSKTPPMSPKVVEKPPVVPSAPEKKPVVRKIAPKK